MTDSTSAVRAAVALVEEWLDDAVTDSFDVLHPNEEDADPLRDLGALIGALIVLAGSFAERAASAQGATDHTQGALEPLDDYRQRTLRGGRAPC